MRFFSSLLTTVFIAGCANSSSDKCGGRFLLLWPNGTGQHSFQEIKIDTMKSPYETKGSIARVYFEGGLAGRGYEGPVARPRLTQSGDVCVPMDVESSFAVSAYAQMEALHAFDVKNGIDQGITWPRNVGVEIRVRTTDGGTHNNAHYFPKDDAIAIIPYSYDGLPMALNHGVMAHEHFHAHFQARVVNHVNAALASQFAMDRLFYPRFNLKPMADDYDRIDLNTTNGLNNFVLRGWNEGLADFYAYVFTDQSNFFNDSRPDLFSLRDLAGEPQAMLSGFHFHQTVQRTSTDQSHQVAALSYQQGTLLARLLFQLSELGPESKELILQRVIQKLPRLAEDLIQNYDRQVYDFDAIVPIILEGAPLNDKACAILASVMPKAKMKRSFNACSSM